MLLLVFMAVLGFAWWSGLEVLCGCFSREDEQLRFAIQIALLRDQL